MEIKVKDKVIDIKPNSKPYFAKHLISITFDIAILFVLLFILTLALFKSSLADTYNQHTAEYVQIEDKYKLESGVGIKTYIENGENNDKYQVYVDENTNQEYIVVTNKEASQQDIEAYNKLLKEDEKYQDLKFAAGLQSYVILVFSCFICEIILFLIIPLCNKYKASIGQLLTGISIITPSRQTYVKWYQVLIKFLFIFIFESCFLFLWAGVYTLLLVPVLDLIVMLLNKDNRSLRDFISNSMLIEKLSYSFLNNQK